MSRVEALIVSMVIVGIACAVALDRFLPREWKPPSRPYEDLKSELQRWVFLSHGALIATLAVVALASTLGFMAATTALRRPPPEAVLVVPPARVMFVAFGFLLGFAAMPLGRGFVMRRMMKERYWDLWFVVNTSGSKYRGIGSPSARDQVIDRRLTVFFLPLLMVTALVGSCLTMDSYAYLTPSEIVVNPFLGLRDQHRRYVEVGSIDTSFAGKHHDQLQCTIHFKDGSRFSTGKPPSRLTNAEVDALAAYVFERTGGPWTHGR